MLKSAARADTKIPKFHHTLRVVNQQKKSCFQALARPEVDVRCKRGNWIQTIQPTNDRSQSVENVNIRVLPFF